jgi:hypothetical protein
LSCRAEEELNRKTGVRRGFLWSDAACTGPGPECCDFRGKLKLEGRARFEVTTDQARPFRGDICVGIEMIDAGTIANSNICFEEDGGRISR